MKSLFFNRSTVQKGQMVMNACVIFISHRVSPFHPLGSPLHQCAALFWKNLSQRWSKEGSVFEILELPSNEGLKKERCYTKIVDFPAVQLQIQFLNLNFEGKRCHCYDSAQKKIKLLHDATGNVFPWALVPPVQTRLSTGLPI